MRAQAWPPRCARVRKRRRPPAHSAAPGEQFSQRVRNTRASLLEPGPQFALDQVVAAFCAHGWQPRAPKAQCAQAKQRRLASTPSCGPQGRGLDGCFSMPAPAGRNARPIMHRVANRQRRRAVVPPPPNPRSLALCPFPCRCLLCVPRGRALSLAPSLSLSLRRV